MLLFWKKIDKTQMSQPFKWAATVFWTWKSFLVGHLGPQSMSYRVETPCRNFFYIHKNNLMQEIIFTCKPTYLSTKKPRGIFFLFLLVAINYSFSKFENTVLIFNMKNVQIKCFIKKVRNTGYLISNWHE